MKLCSALMLILMIATLETHVSKTDRWGGAITIVWGGIDNSVEIDSVFPDNAARMHSITSTMAYAKMSFHT